MSLAAAQAFDELLLLKRGGQTIYCGPLGAQSRHLIAYFQAASHASNPCSGSSSWHTLRMQPLACSSKQVHDIPSHGRHGCAPSS